jgi:two-component system, sensor histidine kinase and response regulator
MCGLKIAFQPSERTLAAAPLPTHFTLLDGRESGSHSFEDEGTTVTTQEQRVSTTTAALSWIEMAHAFACGQDAAELCRPIFDRVLSLSGWTEGALYTVNDDAMWPRRVVASGILDAGDGGRNSAFSAILEPALKGAQAVSFTAAELAKFDVQGTPFQLVNKALVIPVTVASETYAVFVLVDTDSASSRVASLDVVDSLQTELGILSLIFVHEEMTRSVGSGKSNGTPSPHRLLALKTLRDMIPQVVVVKDLENRVISANLRAGEFYRLDPSQMEGEYLWEVDPLNAGSAYRADLRVIESGQMELGQLEKATGIHGEVQWLRVDRAPVFGEGGNVIAVVTTLEDVSEQILARENLRRTVADAARAERRKDQYLLALADEVREPLRQAQKRLCQMRSDVAAPELSVALDEILAIQHQSLSNIQDLLDFSRVENGNLSVQTFDFEIEDVISEVLDACSRTALRRDIELASRVAPRCPNRVAGDANRLRQILIQIMGCALRVARGGEVFLFCGCAEPSGVGQTLRFEVRAPSATLQPRELEEYFACYRSDEAPLDESSTHELRLSLARSLTHLLDGRVEIEVSADRSFVCLCEIPMRSPLEHDAFGENAVPRAGARILLCEPNENMRAVHQQRLRDLHLVVDAASTPALGVEMIRAADQAGWPFDVTFTAYDDPSAIELFESTLESAKRGELVLMVDGSQSAAKAPTLSQLHLPWRQSELCQVLAEACGSQPLEVEEQLSPEGDLGGRFEFLVVDSNPMSSNLTAFALRRLGGRVVVAASRDTALTELEATDFDLVLADEDWLAQGNEAFVDEVRRVDGVQRRTRVAVGAHETGSAQAEELVALGYEGLIAKPLDADALFRILATAGSALV